MNTIGLGVFFHRTVMGGVWIQLHVHSETHQFTIAITLRIAMGDQSWVILFSTSLLLPL